MTQTNSPAPTPKSKRSMRLIRRRSHENEYQPLTPIPEECECMPIETDSPRRISSLVTPCGLDIEGQSLTSAIPKEIESHNIKLSSPRHMFYIAVLSALIVFAHNAMLYDASIDSFLEPPLVAAASQTNSLIDLSSWEKRRLGFVADVNSMGGSSIHLEIDLKNAITTEVGIVDAP